MLLIAVPIENVQEIWPTKTDFDRPNAELVGKWPMANCYFQHCTCIQFLTIGYVTTLLMLNLTALKFDGKSFLSFRS